MEEAMVTDVVRVPDLSNRLRFLNRQAVGLHMNLSDMSRNVALSSSNQPLSTTAVRHLIEESHLDLVNLLTSHLKTVLNPILADTNAKYELLAKKFDSAIGIGDEAISEPYISNDGIMNDTFEVSIIQKIMRYQSRNKLGYLKRVKMQKMFFTM
ncbi:hypothetical protein PIB30_076053 [Stylosanthes scabra]|uniref:Uncharacterized protein n=1 Tax=Stylosanthes scabra TaxID=79078 RepID=A0ABU6QSH2_9FABA|nr:hypothetical protein [Stylosanthes scabra]